MPFVAKPFAAPSAVPASQALEVRAVLVLMNECADQLDYRVGTLGIVKTEVMKAATEYIPLSPASMTSAVISCVRNDSGEIGIFLRLERP
jgi:hypothetical protein